MDYVIEGDFELLPHASPNETTAEHLALFKRRAQRAGERGSFYLGRPDLHADVSLLPRDFGEITSPDEVRQVDFGWMPFDDPDHQGRARFFRARAVDGIIRIPASDDASIFD